MGTFLNTSVVLLTLVSEVLVAGPQQKTSVETLQVDRSASLLCKVPKSVFICTLLSSSIFSFFFFFSCRESIVCAVFLHKNSKFYEMHFPPALME